MIGKTLFETQAIAIVDSTIATSHEEAVNFKLPLVKMCKSIMFNEQSDPVLVSVAMLSVRLDLCDMCVFWSQCNVVYSGPHISI